MSNPNLQYAEDREAFGSGSTSPMPPVPQIPTQYLNQVAGAQPPRLGPNSLYGPAYAHNPVASYPSNDAMMAPVVDIPSLIATKGYNPVNFDTKPTDVRQAFLYTRYLSHYYIPGKIFCYQILYGR
jgi:hypothetical protein